ncbi:hypothetical protein [Pseudomonas petrae]|uniref:hypothetical protein n=1 Tax=Pseudomonas petrae TaxID=2912190 RepID=UPI001EF0A3FA|nr:hypothetical protein [Pseudomonas petrae]MCF7535376.1 hypothetical protein [Pseudomonas petrae]MCF7558687.1 hypothetical protein [Pseudomonas petrae]
MAKSKVTEEARARAIQMRSKGAQYKQIAESLSSEGVTFDWCKRNLSTVKVYDTDYFLIEQITPLGVRPEGIARSELNRFIRKAFGIESGEPIPPKILQRVKRALPDDVFVRPDWMDPQSAEATQRAIVIGTTILMDRLEELTADVCQLCPGASAWHVRDYMLKQLTGDYPGGPLVQGQHMERAVERMVVRMPQITPSERPPLAMDTEYEALCM